MFTVLGSGFGIYGYLPALIEAGHEVTLPNRYRPTVRDRPELARYVDEVTWCADVDAALERSTAAVIALRPQDQAQWVPRLTQMPGLQRLILEKPLAPTPESAAAVLSEVENAGKRYRVGYTFRFTEWADRLRSVLAEPAESITVNWTFLAHHYRTGIDTWKRFSSTGGGAVRFYGVHAIALLSELGYDDVSTSIISGPSNDEAQRWHATFTGPGLCPCALRIDSRETTASFDISVYGHDGAAQTLVSQPGPFASADPGAVNKQDARVGVLRRLCESFSETDDGHAERQRAILALWRVVETTSRRES